MSFVAEILCSAEKIELENINKKVPEIVLMIDGYKQEVLQYIEQIYVKFSRRPASNALLLNKADNLTNTISDVEKVVRDIKTKDANEVMDKVYLYTQQLFEAKEALKLTTGLIHLHEDLLQLKRFLQNKQYVDGIQLAEGMKHRQISEYTQVDVFNGLIDKCLLIHGKLSVQLIKEYKECVQYTSINPFVLTITNSENIEQIIKAIGLCNLSLVDDVVMFLETSILKSVITCKVSVDITKCNNEAQLIVNVLQETEKDDYKEVFKNVLHIAQFLKSYFDYSLSDNATTIDYIGSRLRVNLCEMIISNCLSDTIPSNADELQKYKIIFDDIEHFQNELIKFGIFSKDTDALVNYAKNIDFLYIDKKCQEYLATATEIMKRDLHDMIEIGEHSADCEPVSFLSGVFPYCFISKSTLDLLELADKIVQNARSSVINSEKSKMYSTVHNIFHIYGSVVQAHHQKLLQTIPQQVALFHNNCMYLSYKLSMWDEIYKFDPAFFAKIDLLKTIGNKVFVDSLEQQIKQIEDIMKDSGLASVRTLEILEPITEKSIRQCLRQQELLRTVWHKVLSHSDYNRSIGVILNFLCNFIITEILKIEDISSKAGEQLVDIFKVVLTRGPKLFTNPADIQLYVKNWYRFNELVFILNSSLVEICDRWADGKGPLALQFKSEEIHKLIRALFQNTDRRAAALANICN